MADVLNLIMIQTFFPIQSCNIPSSCFVHSACTFPAAITSLTSLPSFISKYTTSRLTHDIKMQCVKSLLRIMSHIVRSWVAVVCVMNTAFLWSLVENWKCNNDVYCNEIHLSVIWDSHSSRCFLDSIKPYHFLGITNYLL